MRYPPDHKAKAKKAILQAGAGLLQSVVQVVLQFGCAGGGSQNPRVHFVNFGLA